MRHFSSLLFVFFISWILFSCSDNDSENNFTPPPSTLEEKFELDVLEYTVDKNGGDVVVDFTTNTSWSLFTDVDWVVANPDKGNSKDDFVTLEIAPNETGEERQCTITFIFGSEQKQIQIVITQLSLTAVSYVDMRFDDPSVTLNYSDMSGEINVTYSDGNIPNITEGKTVILPAAYNHDIRVVENCKVVGNNVNLQTVQGNMCDLFRNMEFTLTTDPNLQLNTRSRNSGQIVTPSQVSLILGNRRQIIFDESECGVRGVTENAIQLIDITGDFSGEELYKQGNNKLYWEKCIFDLGLNSIFYFNFDEEEITGLSKGDLKDFAFYIDGRVDIDFLLKYIGEKNFEYEEDALIKEGILPTVEMKFMVGTVPVFISFDTHIGKRLIAEAQSKIEVSAGFNAQAHARLGLIWNDVEGLKTITGFTPTYSLYDPTFQAYGSMTVQTSYYPQIEISMYKFLGPWVDIMPYLKDVFEVGMQQTGSGNNYWGWNRSISTGLEARMGLNLDFSLFEVEALNTDVINVAETDLFTAPYKIEVISPYDELYGEGVEIPVTFKVSAYNFLTDSYIPCPGALVCVYEDEKNKQSYISDSDGLVSYIWTPGEGGEWQPVGSRAVIPITATPHSLVAAVKGSKGETVTECVMKIYVD